MKFNDKVVLITWATKWIGKATALDFAKEWAIVIINYSKSEQDAKNVLLQIQKYSQWYIIKCDVSDELQVKKMMQEIIKLYGKLDILVNNVWWYIEWDERNWSSRVWEETLKKNLVSPMNTSKYASELFQKQKSGIIINVASRHALLWQSDAIAYAASKAGVINITQAYAKLLSPFWRANSVSPWATKAWYRLIANEEELNETILRSPNKRLIEPEEIAKVILFLASEESNMITGQNILVDGWK